MSIFTSLPETWRLGTPVVGLFRTALGRDPDIHELAEGVQQLRDGGGTRDLVASLLEHPEFLRRHAGEDTPAFVAALCRNAFGSDAAAPGAHAMGLALDASRAEVLGIVASIALEQGRIPLLPALAPGAAPDDPVAYRMWVQAYGRETAPTAEQPDAAQTCVSIAMIGGDTQAEAMLATIASLQQQAHAAWRLHLCAHTASPWSAEAIRRICAAEPRILAVTRDALWQSWRAAPSALACWLAPGDRLPASALGDVVAAFAAAPDIDLVFTDEDVEDAGGRHAPRFKPAFSPGSGAALIGQLAVCRTSLLARLDPAAAAQPQAELAARAATLAGHRRILHLPRILCHRAEPPAPFVPPARSAGPCLPVPAPLVTVIVPTRDRADLLRACLDGVLRRTDYPQIEVLVVDNGSTAPEATALLTELEQDPHVRILRRPGPFNFAAMNNAAAAQARGSILLLLNNDTEVLEPGWLAAMVAQMSDPGVGIVGARLLYPSGTVQHAGILLGPQGRATHVGRGAAPDEPGYLGQLACVRDLSAVTGACLAIRQSVWAQLGGMDERLAVTWNDVDLCLATRHAGFRVVWTPHATLMHREAVTRGLEAGDPAQLARFRSEQALVQEKWGDAVEHDPFLNPNLVATEAGPLCLAPPRERRAAGCLPARAKAGTPSPQV